MVVNSNPSTNAESIWLSPLQKPRTFEFWPDLQSVSRNASNHSLTPSKVAEMRVWSSHKLRELEALPAPLIIMLRFPIFQVFLQIYRIPIQKLIFDWFLILWTQTSNPFSVVRGGPNTENQLGILRHHNFKGIQRRNVSQVAVPFSPSEWRQIEEWARKG